MNKKIINIMALLLVMGYLTSCVKMVYHSDPFYDFFDDDFPRNHLPLLNPVEATQLNSSSPWELELLNIIWIKLPGINEGYYPYIHVEELEKIAVTNGLIMAYSSYIDQNVDDYILKDFYHWFVTIPSENITKGFHTEEEFNQYILTLGIKDPKWITPDDAFDEYAKTGGCLDWIPDCN